MIPAAAVSFPAEEHKIANLGSIAAAGIEIQIFKVAVIAACAGIGSVADDACGDARLSCAPADKICAPCVIRSSGIPLNLRAVPIAVFGIVS